MEEEIKQSEQGENRAEIDESANAAAFLKQQEKIKELEIENAGLKKAKREFYNAVINGNVPKQDNGPVERSVKDCRADLVKAMDKTNLEYAKAMIALDDACIREQGVSCFLPQGKDVVPTADEVATAKKFRTVIEECIEEADDDPAVFNNELMRRTKPGSNTRKRS